VTACWQSATTWCRQAALSRPCAPTVGFVVARCCAGRPVMRSSQPFSHGHWASIRSIAWRAVSSSDWVAAGTAATRDVLRARRFRAPAQPPRRPTLRHWSMVRLKRILPRSRFMATRFIDRVAPNLKRHSASRCRFTRSEGECTRTPPNRGRTGGYPMRSQDPALLSGVNVNRAARGAHPAARAARPPPARARVNRFPAAPSPSLRDWR
jgi:hypothetical protein